MKREADEGWAKVAGAFEQSGGISGPLRFRLGNGESGEKRKREEASPRLMPFKRFTGHCAPEHGTCREHAGSLARRLSRATSFWTLVFRPAGIERFPTPSNFKDPFSWPREREREQGGICRNLNWKMMAHKRRYFHY